ncbi:TPA: GNAT family N-acetyltransferase [Kluyvera ascorbata]|nr:GNAT family N-acetyltransferase [Kluyvera ascorbata]
MVKDLTEKLSPAHLIADFCSGEPVLDDWLKRRAWQNEETGATRTFVLCSGADKRVMGYYSLSTGAIQREAVPGAFRRNMPEPIPIVLIARFAVDVDYQNQRWGGKMLREAVMRTMLIAQVIGVRGLVVHALSDNAKNFYQRFGFVESPLQPHTLVLPIR